MNPPTPLDWGHPPLAGDGQTESTTTTTPRTTCFPETTTSLSYELTAFRFSTHAGIQCVTDLQREP